MKHIIILTTFLIATSIYSQELPGGQYDRYEIERNKENSDPLGIISAKYKHISNNDYSMNDIGLRVGVYATENILVGAHYFYLFDQSIVFSPESDDVKAALRFDYFGTNIDYFISSSYTLPISVGVNIGFGQMTFTNFVGAPISRDLTGDWVTVIEPEFNMYFNIIPKVLANINVGYRSVTGVEYNNISNKDLSGLSGGLGISVVLY